MKKLLYLLTAIAFLCISSQTMAQRERKNRRNKHNFVPTEQQKLSFKTNFKKILNDSLNIPIAKRDTVAAIELEYALKSMKINSDKSMSKDEKEMHNGMLDGEKYMHLGAILNAEELQRLQAYELRQKKEQEARIQAQKDAAAQQSNTPRNYNRGYGGYGGYYGGY